MKALVIPVFGDAREVDVPDELNPRVSELQRLVGGPIEYVPTEQDVTLFCNEDGKVVRLPANKTATLAFGQLITPHGDYFAGDVVVIGGSDAQGNDTSLDTEAWLAYVKEWSA